jgi:glucosamine--fructose-6-phosphate aminotransferase (isomerizing)
VFRARGAPDGPAAPRAHGAGTLPVVASPHAACTPLLTIASFYRAVNALAVARGHDPDVPPHLAKVTETV